MQELMKSMRAGDDEQSGLLDNEGTQLGTECSTSSSPPR
jgi:hypothetical protein